MSEFRMNMCSSPLSDKEVNEMALSNSDACESALDISSSQVCDDFQDCPEVLTSIGEIFHETYPADITALRLAHQARDQARVAFLAHKLRGSILAFHQYDAARIASELEEKAKAEQLQGAEDLIESLDRAYDRACSTLQRASYLLAHRRRSIA